MNDKYSTLLVLAKHFPAVSVNNLLAVVSELHGEPQPTVGSIDPHPTAVTHEGLVGRVLLSETIMEALVRAQKILAIKELRAQTFCSLKEAKDAVEDARVTRAVDRRRGL